MCTRLALLPVSRVAHTHTRGFAQTAGEKLAEQLLPKAGAIPIPQRRKINYKATSTNRARPATLFFLSRFFVTHSSEPWR